MIMRHEEQSMQRPVFPGSKTFAFTVFDDTDLATVEKVRPVYELLCDLGMRTTKSVWVYPASSPALPFAGSQTLEDPEYLAFVRWLRGEGFEIAFHNASMVSSRRETTSAALERFRDLMGEYPRVHANHHDNRENLYWGHERLDLPVLRWLVAVLRRSSRSSGHIPDSPYFWGDICSRRLQYVRNFVFPEINLMRINPGMPYRDPRRPCVPYWFSSSEGGSVRTFNRLLSPENQDRLEREGGVCIVYTHFASGFVEDGKVQRETESLLRRLSQKGGWFVPVSTLLDHLLGLRKEEVLSRRERAAMELRWFAGKMLRGTS